ncbi:MAG: LicD family protein [Lachnospiraceae bacterium]|jgi:phosphorylcholine metabolism protein LicD|nr:LicD family protein [Lachnospiraceae bacterium]
MKFPDNYFEDEVRDGFYVCGMMKREWAAQMVILQEFSSLCDRLGIKWYAAYGTLIGAVRHKGFIPWDDDIDVWIKRRDYEKFVRHVHELPKNYVFLEGRLDQKGKLKYMNPFGRILNTPDFCADAAFLQKYGGFPYPSGLDIFVLDRLAPTQEEEDVRIKVSEYVWYVMHHLDEEKSVLNGRLMDIEKITGIRFDRNSALDHQLMLVFEQLNMQFEDRGGTYLTSMHDWATVQAYKFHDSCFDSIEELPFENITIRVPAGYDEILTSIYGDYRKPVQAPVHGYPCYRISEEGMEAAGSELPYKYYFHPECLAIPLKAERKGVIRKALSDFVRRHQEMEAVVGPQAGTAAHVGTPESVMAQNGAPESTAACAETAQAGASKSAETQTNINGCAWDKETLSSVLGNAQDAVIYLEHLLTGNYPSETELAEILDTYCEKIFHLYRIITEATEDSSALVGHLQELALQIQNLTEENIIRPKEVVFLPFKAEGWNNLKALYAYYRNMPDTRVYVTSIPYYRKDAWFDPEKTPVYEAEKIRKLILETTYGENTVNGRDNNRGIRERAITGRDVKDGQVPDEHLDVQGVQGTESDILPYQALNLAVHTPDVVVTQNPYDEYGIGFTVDPEFYSTVLQKQAEEVVYVPWFKTDEIGSEHGPARNIACEYIDMPGVIRADHVLLPSERMREVYINKLTKFAGENTRERWEKSIQVYNPNVVS